MGSRIAILRAGRLVQYDRPEAILAHPADAFVESFVGSDRALKRLALMPAIDHATSALTPSADAPRLDRDANLRDALSTLLQAGRDAAFIDQDGAPPRAVTLAAIREALAERANAGTPITQ